MAQYPIPQFIEEEARIVYFLTFRQFFLLVGGGGICLLFYFTLPFYLFVILSIAVGLLAGVIAFVKINNQSIVTVFLNFLGFSVATKNYVWKKKESPYAPKIQKKKDFKNVREIIITNLPKKELDEDKEK